MRFSGILVSENSRLKKALSLFQKAFNVVEKVTKALTFPNGQSVWDKLKSRSYLKGLDEQDYNHFQEVRHDPDLFGKGESKSKAKTIDVNGDFER